ncbi:BPM2 [Symbiodinium sp. CCMP2592]|nr:BPM2 [Symbiodinium sp. CCMP2592]
MDVLSMSSEELRAAIDVQQRQKEANEARRRELEGETQKASERRELRKRLHSMTVLRELSERDIAVEAAKRRRIDHDEQEADSTCDLPHRVQPVDVSVGSRFKLADLVHKAEYVWRIEGFSWMKCGLEQGPDPNVTTRFLLGDEIITFHYSPWPHRLLREQHHGSLAIVLYTKNRIALRYRICAKARNGEFVQWGEKRDVVHEGYGKELCAYGPDVHSPGDQPASLGIFGLSHEELLQSEWVQEDALTVKFEVEVRPMQRFEECRLSPSVEIPEPTILRDLETLLKEGTCSDVRFVVKDEVIPAHSPILCARSEVFSKQLTAGMQECISKVIVIEDSDVATFKAFLQFLYTDRLPEEILPKGIGTNARDPWQLQALLAISHKYEVKRLQLWCEAKLSENINTSQVCGVLCQAHLLQAKQLEKACLSFIKDRADQVLTQPAYVELVKKWPQIGVKVSLFSAGVSHTELLRMVDGMEKPQERSQQVTE